MKELGSKFVGIVIALWVLFTALLLGITPFIAIGYAIWKWMM